MTKPDFIIIGAMKSATSTIHEQLALQKGIFMTTPKEPNFFSDDSQFSKGEDWYSQLFKDAKPEDLRGESSTHYTKLPDYPNTIARMKSFGLEAKLIYVIRQPVDRLISHYIHQWTQNIIKMDINNAISEYSELVSYSRYAMQLKPFINTFGAENIMVVFSESLRVRPQQVLEEIASFIGYQGNVEWADKLPAQNVSQERVRRFYGYSLIVDSRLLKWIRRKFIPKRFREVIKARLRLRERPVISMSNQKKIEEIFNKDLSELGVWLDLPLNYNDYMEIAQTQPGPIRLIKKDGKNSKGS